MTPPTIPPEAVEAAARASYEYRNEESWNGPNDETRLRYRDDAGVIISAVYPFLRRAILAEAEKNGPGLQYTCEAHRDMVKQGGSCCWCQLTSLRLVMLSQRHTILAEAVPQIVAMAREQNFNREGVPLGYRHTPASILAALEKGEA